MKHAPIFLWLAIAALLPQQTAAQTSTLNAPEFIRYTQSPQTWGIMRYGETPVDHATGSVRVDIPIYDYRDPDFSFSLSAGYVSEGFKPQHQTGILGLGWILNCGGVISREIRGIDDFASRLQQGNDYGGFLTGNVRYKDEELFYRLEEMGAPADIGDKRYTYRGIEVEADVFHFNFMGHSGKFHHDGERNIRVYDTNGNHGTYTIELNGAGNGSSSSITVTTADGYVYVFGGDERALERTVPGNFSEFSSGVYNLLGANYSSVVSWMLTSVTAPNGRRIELTYDSHSVSDTYIAQNTPNNPYLITSFTSTYNTVGRTEHYRRAEILRTTYLTRVSVDDDFRIDFTYSLKGCCDIDKRQLPALSASEPLYAAGGIVQELKRLDAIDISHAGKPLKNCRFIYQIKDNRLLLEQVSVSGTGHYSMLYYEPCAYPDILTADVDFWGYYNGRGNRFSDIDPMDIRNETVSLDEYIRYPFRNPDAAYGILGCLKRIVYPLQGYTDFEYEAHTAQWLVHKCKHSGYSTIIPADPERPYDPGIESGKVSWEYLSVLDYYSSRFETSETGGVRIARIVDSDGLSGCRIRRFEYHDGTVTSLPRFWAYKMGNTLVRMPLLEYPANAFDRVHVGYESVEELLADGSSLLYTFSNYRSHPDKYEKQVQMTLSGGNGYVYDIDTYKKFMNNILRLANSHHYQRWKLLTKTAYDATGHRVRHESMVYEDHTKEFTTTVVESGPYAYSVKIPIADYRLQGLWATDFFGSDSVYTYTAYRYNDLGQTVLVTREDGERTSATATIYLHETATGRETPCGLPYEIREQMLRSDSLLTTAATRYTYMQRGRMWLPALEHRTVLKTPAAEGKPLAYHDRLVYEAYDSAGNPTQIRDAEGNRVAYIWGYGGLYPVIRAINATYEQIKSALGHIGDRPLASFPSREAIDRLYTLPDALVEVFEYTPHVGPIRKIDPSGREFRFSYDPDGRLIEKSDAQGLVERYEYHL